MNFGGVFTIISVLLGTYTNGGVGFDAIQDYKTYDDILLCDAEYPNGNYIVNTNNNIVDVSVDLLNNTLHNCIYYRYIKRGRGIEFNDKGRALFLNTGNINHNVKRYINRYLSCKKTIKDFIIDNKLRPYKSIKYYMIKYNSNIGLKYKDNITVTAYQARRRYTAFEHSC